MLYSQVSQADRQTDSKVGVRRGGHRFLSLVMAVEEAGKKEGEALVEEEVVLLLFICR